MRPPKIEPKKTWEEFFLPFKIGSGRDFYPETGEPSMRMAFFRNITDDSLIGRVWFGHPVEGPPGHVHGGVSSYVLDEAMGSVTWMNHYGCVAKSLEIEFLNMTPIGVDLEVVARITKIEKKECFVEAQIQLQDGTPLSRATGVFHRLSKAKLTTTFANWDTQYDFGQIIYPD